MNSLYSNLIGYWPLHEASGTRFDATGSANDLTDNNTVVQAAGRVVNAGDFTAVNSESLHHADSAVLSTGNIDFTVGIWVNPKTLGLFEMMAKISVAAGNYEWDLYITGVGGTITFRVSSNGTALTALNSSNTLATGGWYLCFGWHDAVNDTLNVWLNGVLTSTAYASGVFDGAANFRIGANDAGSYMNGYLCEAMYWKRILTETERQWLYNNGMGRTYPFDGRVSPFMLGRKKLPRRNRLTGIAI